MALANQSTFLAQDIPARTFAVGANALVRRDLSPITRENIDMKSRFRGWGWPSTRLLSAKKDRWLHSDLHDLPFEYTGMAFEKFVQTEGE
jgi:hypothetical protein